MVAQKTDKSIEEIDRETLFKYIETKDFLAVMFCEFMIFENVLHLNEFNPTFIRC